MPRARSAGASSARAALRGASCVLACVAGPAGAEEPRNWFDDPFFAVSAAVAGCPQPAGPFTGEGGRREAAHRRAEKGTTCWLAGACERASAFAYDREIAAALRERLSADAHLARVSSLWVTVQGRVVYIDGCASDGSVAREAEAIARAVPQVEQAIAAVRTDARARPPYRTLDAERGR